MAHITATAGFNTFDPAAWTGRPSFLGTNQMTVTNGYDSIRIEGTGLTYWGTQLTGGTVTKIQYFQGEQLRGTIDNMFASAYTVGSHVASGNYAGLYRAIQSGNDSITASAWDDRLAGHDGDDTIRAGGGSDQVFAGAGNDTIILSRGTTYVDGSSGFDVVYMPGHGGTYGQSKTAEGWQFWNNAEGINSNIANVERVAFSDGVLAFDVNGNAGMGFRVYQAAFARDPDASGLGFWIRELDAGHKNPHSMAADFIYSGEFINKYGTPETVSNARYIELLYINALGRQLDQGGFNFWNDELNSGRRDRADLLLSFADSPENRAQTAPEISDGIWYV
jgi:serralysin